MSYLFPPPELGDITSHIPAAVLDIRYATTNNITGTQLYTQQLAWLRHEPLDQLAQAANELAADDYVLVIYDAFRPLSVQEKLRAVCNDNNYVAEISNHCRGITIDVTLASAQGVYLDMGTEYDDFTDKAHPGTPLITREQKLNRQLLTDVLTKYGFKQHSHEWWHFDYRPEQTWTVIQDESNTFMV